MNIFIGYDPKEAIAYHVLAHSLMRHASKPVTITPLILPQLQEMGVYWRERDPKQSTDFTFSRFLTPYLAQDRISVFMDCDMLCTSDIYELEDLAMSQPFADVLVVQHDDYMPATERKFLDQPQTTYPCKNWSSVMVFNGHRMGTRNLTPDYVNKASAMDLHQFKWARSVGNLPHEWNHLVGEYNPNPDAKLIHYTLGGPWFSDYLDCEHSLKWFEEYQLMSFAANN